MKNSSTSVSSSRARLSASIEKQESPRLYVVRFDPSLLDPVRSAHSNLARMKSKSVSSAPGASRRFVAPGFRGRWSVAAAASSIISNSTSVALPAYWGTLSTHPVADARIPSPVGACIPFAADDQVPAATVRFCYGSPSTQEGVHGSSVVDLL
jgi:hypothetical protein